MVLVEKCIVTCYICLLFSLYVSARKEDYFTWPDGDGLTNDERNFIKRSFKQLADSSRVPKPKKILKTMVMYEAKRIVYLSSYIGGGFVCSGRIVRNAGSKTCEKKLTKIKCIT